jgi:glycosyltransferase involved in cell wall biosynthesis
LKKQTDISVIIPTFGRPELVVRAARSALEQKLPDNAGFEVIVVDDGGNDGTAEALKALKAGPRLRYFWKKHAGPAAARNAGLAMAKGRVLAFLDSDTLARPGWLAAGWKALKAHPGWDGCEGRVRAQTLEPETPFTHRVENPSGGRWLTCDLFFRRESFKAVGGFDERFKKPVREDSEFAFRALQKGKTVGFEPEALVTHPVLRLSVSRYFRHAREGMYEALIERQHPVLYRLWFKWIDGRALPVYYWPAYLALPLAFLCRDLGIWSLALGWLGTMVAWCRKKQVRPTDLIKLAMPALVVPWLRLFWVAWGYWKYPKSPE